MDLKTRVRKLIAYARKQKADLRYKVPVRVVPRKYQKECTRSFVNHLRDNNYAFGILATGTGKTLIARLVAELLLDNKTKGLYIAHMPTLLTQFQREFCIDSDFFPVQYDDPDPTSCLQMQTIQSLLSLRKRNMSAYRKHIRRYKYVFFDEVHHYSISQLKKWNKVAEDLLRNGCKFICLTATPDRHDGAPILVKNYEDHIVYTYEIQEGVHDCYLSEVYGLAVQTKIEPDSCRWKGADLELEFSDAKFSERTRVIAKTLQYVNEYRKRRCQTIIFVRRVTEAHRLAEELAKYKLGEIRAIDAKTKQKKREEIFEAFENKEVNILINVGTLVEGVNLPSCDTVAMCRSTRSRGFYRQMLGRGTRVCAGKDFLLVIDFVDNIANHHFGDVQTCASLLELEEKVLVTGPIFTQKRKRNSKADQEARIVETFYEDVSLYRRFLPTEEACDLIQRIPVMRDAETGQIDIEATKTLHVKFAGVW